LRFAIPHAPRAVKLRQVPGALRRLGVVALLGMTLAAAAALGGRWVSRFVSRERGFLARAVEVTGQVNRIHLPPPSEREGRMATVDVLYVFDERHVTVSGVAARAEQAEGWGPGAEVTLLVDPADPERPREAGAARLAAQRLDLWPYGLGAGVVVGALLFALELRRTYRADVEPLRKGALVWLTPAQPLPDTLRETTFRASYYRDDVKLDVRARGRPGRAPVRNGEKVLAAVVPKKPTWVRIIDADLAKTLGWIADG
jgi:hypothetical protein